MRAFFKEYAVLIVSVIAVGSMICAAVYLNRDLSSTSEAQAQYYEIIDSGTKPVNTGGEQFRDEAIGDDILNEAE